MALLRTSAQKGIPLRQTTQIQPFRLVGLLLVVAGIIGVIFFSVFYDTTVEVPHGGRVHHVGEMQNRQLGIIVSAVGVLSGVILIAVAALKQKPLQSSPSSESPTMQDLLERQESPDSERVKKLASELKRNIQAHSAPGSSPRDGHKGQS